MKFKKTLAGIAAAAMAATTVSAFSFGASNAVQTIVLNGKEPASTFASQKKVISKMMEKTLKDLIGE